MVRLKKAKSLEVWFSEEKINFFKKLLFGGGWKLCERRSIWKFKRIVY